MDLRNIKPTPKVLFCDLVEDFTLKNYPPKVLFVDLVGDFWYKHE